MKILASIFRRRRERRSYCSADKRTDRDIDRFEKYLPVHDPIFRSPNGFKCQQLVLLSAVIFCFVACNKPVWSCDMRPFSISRYSSTSLSVRAVYGYDVGTRNYLLHFPPLFCLTKGRWTPLQFDWCSDQKCHAFQLSRRHGCSFVWNIQKNTHCRFSLEFPSAANRRVVHTTYTASFSNISLLSSAESVFFELVRDG